MAEREVRYCTTEDGVRIAYCVEGDGPPLVVTPFLAESFDLEHLVPQWEQLFRLLREGFQLVRYDMRGVGLSEPGTDDVGPPARARDLDAVVQAAGLRRFALLAWGMQGPVGIHYAATQRGRVQALILYCTYSRGLDIMTEEAGRSLADLARANWGLAARAIADLSSRREFGEAGLAMAHWYRQSTTGETCARLWEACMETDVSDELAQIRCPALVVYPRDDPSWRLAVGQRLAAAIPGARLVPVPGGFHAAAFVRAGETVTIIRDFLAETASPKRRARAPSPSAADVHTILFTDMESSAALRQRQGDEKAQELVRVHNAIVREALRAQKGKEIKHTGDGIMATFASASQALRSAVAIQRGVAAHVEEHPDAALRVYIGLNAGEPIVEEGDLFGTSVDLAKRICDQCQPGEILVSDVVRQLAAGKRFLFSDRGDTALRGFEDPVRLYEVSWRED